MEDDITKNKHFLMALEQVIQVSNREIIHSRIPPITSERMLSFAVTLAKLRAEYIQAAFQFADSNHADGEEVAKGIDNLSICRRQFTEARDAFIALQRAIELAYVAVE